MKIEKPILNDVLRIIRVFHNLKAVDLAKRLDVSPSYLSEIETGKKDPTLDLLNRYAKQFKIPTSAILFFSETKGSKVKTSWIKSKLAPRIVKFLKEIEDAGS